MGSLTAVGYKAFEDYTGYSGILGHGVAIGHYMPMNMTTPYHIVTIGYNARPRNYWWYIMYFGWFKRAQGH